MERSAFFSRRLTCACEMLTSLATSICVLPSKKRRRIMLRSRSGSLETASRSAISSTQLSSRFFLSLIWSITYSVSPPSENTGSYKESGVCIASSAMTISSFGSPTSAAISITVGSCWFFFVSMSLA